MAEIVRINLAPVSVADCKVAVTTGALENADPLLKEIVPDGLSPTLKLPLLIFKLVMVLAENTRFPVLTPDAELDTPLSMYALPLEASSLFILISESTMP
jgi:hypothetical protein